jgi:membrane fusion protein (multidrug efflux system)
MKKALSTAALLTLLLGVAGGAYWLGKTQSPSAVADPAAAPNNGKAAAGAGNAPGVAVEIIKVRSTRLAQSITAVGSLRSDESVVIRPEIAGRVAEILFSEGSRVARGAPLIRFDASVQRAELAQSEANLSLSQSKLERALDLQKTGFISSQARDEADNNFRVAKAAHELSAAKLTKLEIRAPFSGIVGLRQISIGDYVKDGQDMVNLEGVDPLKVDFKVPEIYLKQVRVGQGLQIALDAFPNQDFEGRVFAINPLVDSNGRSIVIRAVVKNGEARLRPGMFARVRLLLSESRDSLTVPEQALFPVGDDKYVFRIVDGRAQRVKIDIGQRREGQVEVEAGLNLDDLVVTAGQLKLRDGITVKVVEAPLARPGTPAPNAAPALAPAAAAGKLAVEADNDLRNANSKREKS